METIDLRLPVVVVTALVDSINPCAIGVLILLISCLLALSHNRRRMLFVGIVYIAAVYISYLLAGIGLLLFIQRLSPNIAEIIGTVVGGIVILLGLVEMKDFFWYGKGFSLAIPASQIDRIKHYAEKSTIPAVLFLGVLVAAVELPCTGGPYLAITTILARHFDQRAFLYLMLYNFIFVLPLIVILLLSFFGTSIQKVNDWKMKYRKWMRLGMGLLMVGLGVLLILYANGTITLR